VNGAEDPLSGQVALLEEARALGTLLQQGWKPRRTIIYCAWDGEEEGLLGSTEWAEQHADELQQHAAVYINSDGNGRGYLGLPPVSVAICISPVVTSRADAPYRSVRVLGSPDMKAASAFGHQLCAIE
jgi:Zn-dependent M28 family amino/carboxypeptidase